MARVEKEYKCSECDNITSRWFGKCPKCGAWSSLFEQQPAQKQQAAEAAGYKTKQAIQPTKLARNISELNKTPIQRTPTGIAEFDRVLGGGFVDAEVVLFAGQPGAGKSTLSITVADRFATQGKTVLYCSGEESEQQIGLRAQRLGISSDNIKIVNETNLETILGHIEHQNPAFVIVDSLQTVASSEVSGSMGSVAQSKEAAHILTKTAKSQGISMILVSQVVKSGDFSGSESIQHIVDAALMLESDVDSPLKFLRATKNRFGDTTEVGVFQHSEAGLMEVSDPSGVLLETEDDNVAGTSCAIISEGVRQMPTEIQALAARSALPTPRKQFNGVDYQRGQIVCAILDKFCSANLFSYDVYVSTVSGIRVQDPQADLSIAASIISSLKDKPIATDKCFVGELTLTGQVRGSFMIENKIKEAARLGFREIIVPKVAISRLPKGFADSADIRVTPIKAVGELTKFLNRG